MAGGSLSLNSQSICFQRHPVCRIACRQPFSPLKNTSLASLDRLTPHGTTLSWMHTSCVHETRKKPKTFEYEDTALPDRCPRNLSIATSVAQTFRVPTAECFLSHSSLSQLSCKATTNRAALGFAFLQWILAFPLLVILPRSQGFL